MGGTVGRNIERRWRRSRPILRSVSSRRAPSIALRRQASTRKTVDTQGYWTVQDSPSPVVQFRRGSFEGESLRQGRIYYVDDFLNDKKEIEMKPESFLKWAKMVHSTLKKFLKRRKSRYVEYIGPDAQAWLDAGNGHLEDSFGDPVVD
jgi:hypothetical protein